VAVFRYTVTLYDREEHVEAGTVLARNEDEAKEKVGRLFQIDQLKLRRLNGISSLLKSITADIK
jgi:hypothetical protein